MPGRGGRQPQLEGPPGTGKTRLAFLRTRISELRVQIGVGEARRPSGDFRRLALPVSACARLRYSGRDGELS